MIKPLKLLYYNWVDYLDEQGRGGGVSVYQRNLMAELSKTGHVESVFLSSGLSYDLPSGAPRWEPQRHGSLQDREKRYEIVNSGVLAPAHHSFDATQAQISHDATHEVFFDFLERTGPYDVVHFNNLEGVPASVLSLKERWPNTRVVLSIHNYYFACSQVNLWYQERAVCKDYDGGRKCAHCLPVRHNPQHIRLANGLAYRLKRAGMHPESRMFRFCFVWAMRLARRAVGLLKRRTHRGRVQTETLQALPPSDGMAFAARREAMVGAINRYCDRVLCVSKAVQALTIQYGVDPSLTHTNYIGTRAADLFDETAPRSDMLGADGTLTLGFLGYMRRDKGFFFLLEALEKLPDALARRVRLVVAAGRGDATTMERLEGLRNHLAEIRYVDGYTHDDLDTILAPVDVGVIPVLWHDNLPQVAIEMHARHIPLLTADMGGAQELGNCPDMVFAAGDIAAFHGRIGALLSNQVNVQTYWQHARPPMRMAAHVQELFRHYQV